MENSKKDRSSIILLSVIILSLILLGIFAAGFYFNHSKINQLTKSLQDTQKQVQNAKEESMEAKKNIAEEKMSGILNTADAIKDVKNPSVRLALAKAYLSSIRPSLTPASQADLDTVLLFVGKNPNVLITKKITLPQQVVTAISNLKAKMTALKIAGIVTMQKIDKAIYTPGEIVTLTGKIEFIEDDQITGGGVFTLTDSKTGYVYYLEFNAANSANIKTNMAGEEVTMDVKVTSKASEPLIFQVIKGPTLTAKPTVSIKATQTTTPDVTP